MRIQRPACGIENRTVRALRPATKNIVTEKPPIDSGSCQRSLLVNTVKQKRLIVEVSRYNARSLDISDRIDSSGVRLDKSCTVNSLAPQWSRWALNSDLPQSQIAIRSGSVRRVSRRTLDGDA